jgi:hypothetical protein
MVTNSVVSLPYYTILILWEKELEGVWEYFSQPVHPLLLPSLFLAILLAFSSEYTGTWICTKRTQSA